MKKLLILFISIVFFESCGEEESECFPGLRANYITTSDVDSVHFFLNNKRICENYNYENDDEGFLLYSILYRTIIDGNDTTLIAHNDNDISKWSLSQNALIWKYYECIVDRRDDIDSSKITLVIYSNKGINELKTDYNFVSGNKYNIIAIQDTTEWYSYSDSFLSADPPETWEREECHIGHCFARKKIKEICFEK